MNLQQLDYVLAIAREGSITKAAHALYKAQPNISNALKELEAELGIRIFERTSNGVLLTLAGETFLNQASSLVEQAKRLQDYYQHPKHDEIQFRISAARSSYMVQGLSEWINEKIEKDVSLQIHLIETNSNQVIDDISNARSDLGIIRIPSEQEPLFLALLQTKHILHQTITEFPLRLVFKKNHPLHHLENIVYQDLAPFTEIIHGDDRLLAIQKLQINTEMEMQQHSRRVYVYDRGSQISLLETIKDAYMWVSPIPSSMLDTYDMVLRDVSFATVRNKDILIYRKDLTNLHLVQSCCDYLHTFALRLLEDTEKQVTRGS